MLVPMQFSWMDSTYRLSRGNTSELLKDLQIYIVMRLFRGVVWSSPNFIISVPAWNIPSSWLRDLGGTWRGMKSIYWLSKHSMIHIPPSECVKADTCRIQEPDVWCNRSIVQSNQVQMDDNRLVYAGEWNNITYDPLVYRVSKTPGSTISFQFKGKHSLVHGKLI